MLRCHTHRYVSVSGKPVWASRPFNESVGIAVKLNKNEQSLAIALICVLVMLGIGVVASKLYETYEQERLDALDRVEKKKYNQTFSIGEEIVLDSAKDQILLSSGRKYEADFPWVGRMDVTVDQARLYDNPDNLLGNLDAGDRWVQFLDFESLQPARKSGSDERYLLLDVTMRNISAKADSETRAGKVWFTSSFINLSVQHHDVEMLGFSGMPQEGDINTDIGYFDLPIGEIASYQLVYSVNNEAEPEDMFCYMGTLYTPNKYRVDLSDMEVVAEEA